MVVVKVKEGSIDIHIDLLHLNEHTKLLSDVLFATPALRRLHVAEIIHRDSDGSIFQEYTQFPKLPHLEYIHAHMPALEALIPGSRVSTVGVASEKLGLSLPLHYPRGLEFWQQLAALMKKSRRPIEKLDVPVLFYINICCANYFPELRSLTLRLKHPNWVYDTWFNSQENICDKVTNMIMDSWPEHTDLTELEIVFRDNERLCLNPWTLLDVNIIFPSLTNLVLTCTGTNKREKYTWPEENWYPPASDAANTPDSS